MSEVVKQPACWSWAVPPIRTVADLMAEIDAANVGLPRDDQRDPRAAIYLIGGDGGRRHQFDAFHARRCAVCAYAGERLVEDHDHWTGLVRGQLCRSCNLREGHGWGGEFALYRERPPATILSYREYYVGFNWIQGWWENPLLARTLTGNRAGGVASALAPPVARSVTRGAWQRVNAVVPGLFGRGWW